MILTVSGNGRVEIPAALRRQYRFEAGTRVCFVDYGGVLALVPALEDPVREAAGMLQGPTPLTRILLTERQVE